MINLVTINCYFLVSLSGDNQVNITIEIQPDSIPEVDEEFIVHLINVTNPEKLQIGAVSIWLESETSWACVYLSLVVLLLVRPNVNFIQTLDGRKRETSSLSETDNVGIPGDTSHIWTVEFWWELEYIRTCQL